jgi:hypothetical protein
MRRLCDRFISADYEMSNYGIIKPECARYLVDDGAVGLYVHENVVRFVYLVDWMCQLAATPVFSAMNGTTGIRDHALVFFNHRRHLLALIRMDQEYDLVMSHERLLSDSGPAAAVPTSLPPITAVRQGVDGTASPKATRPPLIVPPGGPAEGAAYYAMAGAFATPARAAQRAAPALAGGSFAARCRRAS